MAAVGRALAALFALASVTGLVWRVSSARMSRGTPGERAFPVPAADAWTPIDAMVPSEETREVVPWQLRVHDAWRASYGKMPLLRSHARVCRPPRLQVQVDSPFKSENQFGKLKRSYVCLRAWPVRFPPPRSARTDAPLQATSSAAGRTWRSCGTGARTRSTTRTRCVDALSGLPPRTTDARARARPPRPRT